MVGVGSVEEEVRGTEEVTWQGEGDEGVVGDWEIEILRLTVKSVERDNCV